MSFTVVATGATTYKWHKLSGGNATIGTQATLTLVNISDSDADTYSVVVGNNSGSVTSSNAILTVTHPPVITSQPSSVVVNTGDEADFYVDVNGTTPFAYQWQSNGVALTGQTDSSLSLSPTLDSFAAAYSVAITNSDGSSNSGNALLTVVEPAIIGTPSLAADSCTTVSLSVLVYSSDPSLQYQWYFSTNMTPVGTNGPILSLTNISFANAGLYTVTVSNSAGSSASATNTLTVQDPAPVISGCPSDILTNTGPGRLTCDQVVTWVPPTASDNCGVTNFTANYNPGATFPVGTTTVTYTAIDSSNLSTTCSFNVTVTDSTPPTVVANAITVDLDAYGSYTLTPSDVANITSGSFDNCGIASTNVSPTTFYCGNVGANTVTVILTDIHGNLATNTTTVTVKDITPPTVVANPITVNLHPDGRYLLTGADVAAITSGSSDACGIAATNVFPYRFDCGNVGANTVTVVLTDVNGNKATNTTAVTVKDVTPPTVVLSPITVYLNSNGLYTLSGSDLAALTAGSSDACGIASTNVNPTSFICGNVGPNNVTVTMTDINGNSATNTTTVTVSNVIPPVVVFTPISVQLDASGNYTLTASDLANIAAGSSEACGIALTNVTPSTFTYCNVGSNNVTLTLTDVNGNSASTNGTITVLSPTNPPAIVYVDTNYTSGCAVPFPFIGGSGTNFVGYNAFPTIQAGLNAVATNGTVNVAPGTYNEDPNIVKSVTLTSSGGRGVTTIALKTTGSVYLDTVLVQASSVSVQGFTVVGFDALTGTDDDLASIDFLLNPGVTNINIDNNLIEVGAISANSNGDDGKGVLTTYSPTPPFADTINLNGNIFQPVDGGNVESVEGARAFYINPTVVNFSFTSNTITGNLYHSTTEANNSVIEGNTVIGTGTADDSGGFGIYGSMEPTNGNAIVENNVITNTQNAILLFDTTGVTIENNMLDGNGTGVELEDVAGGVNFSSNQIVDNSMANDTVAGIDNEAVLGSPNAVSNWWGNVSGPSSTNVNYYGTGSGIIGNIAFVPWLNSGANSITNGFAPASPAPAYPPVQLVFTTQPGGANLGSLLSSQPVVQLEDTNGNVTPWANPVVTNTLGNDLTGAILLGTTNEPAASGVATFTDLYVTIAGGSNFTLVASAPALPNATSSAFNITNPVPAITNINPFFARAGGSNFTLYVFGSGFVGDSVVYWNNIPLTTTYVSSTELTAMVLASYISSVGPNTVTVISPGPGGGTTAPTNFSVDVAFPPIVYVDTNYVGLPTNTLVNWPYTGAGSHIIGYDAFPTIQEGVDGVAVGGTVNVAAGTYTEEVTIANPLSLLGPNATNNPNTAPRIAEAVIQPDTSDPEISDSTGVVLISIASSNVTVKGLTIDGYNPDLTNAVYSSGYFGYGPSGTNYLGVFYTSGTNYFNAAVGIGDYTGDSSIKIENNIVKNDAYAGIDLESDGPGSPPNSNSFIKCNLLENMDYNAEGYGTGISLYNNYYAEISGNTLLNVAIGISPQSYFLANPGDARGQSICSNNVSTSLLGIWLNLVYESASTLNISDNTVSFAPTNGSPLYALQFGPPEWDAIELTSIQSATSVVASNNVITGSATNVGYNTVGFNIWNTPTTGSVAIIGGSVSNANYGVWVNNYDGYASVPVPNIGTRAVVEGVNISGASLAGIYVQDDPRSSTNGAPVQATVTGNTVINDSPVGVWVQGTNAGASVINNNASITGNAVGVSVDTGVALLQNNDLTSNSLAGISATNGAIVDAGDCSGGDVTGLGTGSGTHGSSTGGNNLSYGFGGAPWAILNVSGCTILAEQDNFGATMPTNIAAAFNDPSAAIVYSQSPAVVAAPAGVSVTCDGQVPIPARSLSAFISQGGYVSVGPASYWQTNLTVTPSDNNYPVVGNGTDIRTYTIVDSCSNYTVSQTNTVLNTNLPVFTFTPLNVLQGTDPHSCTATVSITPATATGYCDGPDGQPTVTVTASRSDLDPSVHDPYPIGLTTIIWTALDIYGNQSTYTQTVTVQDTTPPVVGTWPANQNLYVDGTCEASVPDLTSQVQVTFSCNGVNITQVPPANTMVSVGTTNVTVVVTAADNPNNSVSNTVVLTVIDTNPPTLAYVDTNYATLPAGTIVTFPYNGGIGTHYVGCDAFGTIQGGINRVASNGMVNVAAGLYIEDVRITQPLSLLGPNATNNPNTHARVMEAVIEPNTSNPEMFDYVNGQSPLYYSSNAVVVVTIASSSVNIKGFTVDGYNPVLPGAFQSGTDYFSAAVGIGDLNGDNSICIENNIIQNDAFAGVDLESDLNGLPTTNSFVKHNLFKNLEYNGDGYGDGVYLQQNYYAEVSENYMTNVAFGVSPQWYYAANPGDVRGQSICSNNISANVAGIFLNLAYTSASTFNINGNTVAFSPTNGGPNYAVSVGNPLEWDGMLITSIQSGVGMMASNNIIIGTPANVGYNVVGYNFWNTPTTNSITIAGGSVSNVSFGVWVSDYDGFQSPADTTQATISGLDIVNASQAGVYVQDDPRASANGVLVQATVTGNTVISGSGLGVWVQGTNAQGTVLNNSASISGNAVGVSVDTGVALLQNNDLTSNSLAGIIATNGAIVDAGNCTGANVTGLGISTGGNNLSYGFTGPALAIINANAGGSPIVLADHDNFGAVVGNNIPGAFSGKVEYSQSPAVIAAPTNVLVVCASDVPAGVTSLSNYVAQGGYYSASTAASVSSSDDTNFLGSGVIHRTYTVTDGCSVASTAVQTITVSDTVPPYFTQVPTNIIVPVDHGQTNATDVTWLATAGDNCAVQSVVSTPPSGSTFPVGVTTVTVVATDTSGNQTMTNFTVLVVGLPQITQQPMSRTNNAGTIATFSVTATSPTQLFYLWKKNGVALSDTNNISGSATATLTVANVSDSDVASYSVCVSNLAGKVISSPATLTVIDPPVIVSITPASQTNNASTTATFSVSVTGTAPFTYQWTKITTNATNMLMDGGNILGSTSNVLTISNLLAADQAEYEVAVSNPAGSPTTNGTLFVIDPAILVQPVGVTTNQGGNATFTVVAAGTAPLSYQWQQDNVDLPGQTASTLTVSDAQDSDEGGYTVVVSNSVGQITSASATLTLTHPPVIIAQPASRTNNLGTTATFTVSVNGATPFTYQWEKNGTNISGATNRTLVLSSVTPADAASYQVAITNSDGNILSAAATLTVIVPPAITSQPTGLTNNAGTTATFSATASGTSPAYQWYQVTATATNALSDSNNISGSLSNVLTISNVLGADSGSYYLVASNQAGIAVSSNAIFVVIDPIITNEPVSMTVNLGSPASFSVGAYGTSPQYQWFKNGTNIIGANASTYSIAAAADSDRGNYTVIVTNIYGMVTSAPPAMLTVIDPPVITGQPMSQTNNAGTTATFSVTATGTSPSYQWYQGATPIGGANSATLTLPNVQDASQGSYSVVLSNAAGVVTSASATLTVIDAPMITGQPMSRTNNAGTTATFSVTATGTSPSYQWYLGASPIGGANSATLTLPNVQDANAGSYSVVLSNAAGVVTSASATLTVIDAPVITGQPMSRTNNAGTTATFSVTATGTSPSYQWYEGATPIGGANTATLTLPNVQDASQGSYSVVLSNAAGVVTSASATLTVIDAPVITGQPSSVTNNASTTATFSVTNTGTLPLVYQWYKITLTSTNALSDTNNISGSASNVLTVSNVLASDEASYSVTITNAAGSAMSSNAMLVVIDPVIFVQPVGSTNFDGSTATFSVTAAGTAPLNYQWFQGDVALYGDTNSTLTLTNLADDDAGTYTVVVSNSVGSVTSSPAVLLTVAPLITTQPSNVTVIQGGSADFSVSVDGETPFQYQWLFNGTNLFGATNRIYALSNVTTNNTGNYQVIVANPIGAQTSQVATLTVVVPPAITVQPTNVIAVAGQTVNFNVGATGTPLFYQWHFNSTNLPFATNATLMLNGVNTNNSGTYFVTVTNIGGSVTSSNVTLAVYATAVPSLTLVSYTNGAATLELVGVPTFNYSILASSNLLEWAPVVTNASPFTFTNTNSASQQFYRGHYLP